MFRCMKPRTKYVYSCIEEPNHKNGSALLLSGLIEPEAYIGEVYSLNYDEALVQVQDADRRKVGGIPAMSLLAATRINPKNYFDVGDEESSIILLRVIDRGELPIGQGVHSPQAHGCKQSDRRRRKNVGRRGDNRSDPAAGA